MLGTPGPAALALAGVGASYGFRAGIPFLAGILCGGAVVIALSAFGVSAVLGAYPAVRRALQIVAFGYFLYLAWTIYRGRNVTTLTAQRLQAPSFGYGFFFNLVNPKTYAVFAAIFASFALDAGSPRLSLMVTAAISFLFLVFIDMMWIFVGASLEKLAADPRWGPRVRMAFAIGMVLAAGLSLLSL